MSERTYSVWVESEKRMQQLIDGCDRAVVFAHEQGRPEDRWRIIGTHKEVPDLVAVAASLYDQAASQGAKLPKRNWGPGTGRPTAGLPTGEKRTVSVPLDKLNPQQLEAINAAFGTKAEPTKAPAVPE